MDKFGHHIIKKNMIVSDIIDILDKGIINGNEEINLQSKKLTGIATPVKANDAVNKDYVDKQYELFASKHQVLEMCNAIKSEFIKKLNHLREDFTKTYSENSLQ